MNSTQLASKSFERKQIHNIIHNYNEAKGKNNCKWNRLANICSSQNIERNASHAISVLLSVGSFQFDSICCMRLVGGWLLFMRVCTMHRNEWYSLVSVERTRTIAHTNRKRQKRTNLFPIELSSFLCDSFFLCQIHGTLSLNSLLLLRFVKWGWLWCCMLVTVKYSIKRDKNQFV